MMTLSYPLGSLFGECRIYTTPGYFHISFSFSAPVVLEKIFLSIFQCKSWIYYNGPLLPKGVMILIIRNLHYPKMLPHKFQLFESISQTFLFLVKWQHSLLKSKTYTQNYVSLCSLLMCQVIFKSDQNCRRSSI